MICVCLRVSSLDWNSLLCLVSKTIIRQCVGPCVCVCVYKKSNWIHRMIKDLLCTSIIKSCSGECVCTFLSVLLSAMCVASSSG